MAIRLFQSQTSMFCEKIRIVFAMKGIPYEVVDVRKDERKYDPEQAGRRTGRRHLHPDLRGSGQLPSAPPLSCHRRLLYAQRMVLYPS